MWLNPEKSRRCARQTGFSLIEMAIVMVILGLMLGTLLMPLSTQRELSNRKDTERQLAEIHDALLGFAAARGRLPCPASNASNSVADPDTATPNCAQEHGFVPARTLGLNGAFDANNRLLDAWNNPIRYSLSSVDSWRYANAIRAGSADADYRICRQSGCAPGDILAERVVAVIHSRGKDGAQTPASPNQSENNDNDRDFVMRTPTEGVNTEFDDIVLWVSPNILTYALLRAGQLDDG